MHNISCLKTAPSLFATEKTSAFLLKDCGTTAGGLRLSYLQPKCLDCCTSGNGRLLLPTPTATDGKRLKEFSLKTIYSTFMLKRNSGALPGVIGAILSQRSELTLEKICLTYESMMGYPQRWTE